MVKNEFYVLDSVCVLKTFMIVLISTYQYYFDYRSPSWLVCHFFVIMILKYLLWNSRFLLMLASLKIIILKWRVSLNRREGQWIKKQNDENALIISVYYNFMVVVSIFLLT